MKRQEIAIRHGRMLKEIREEAGMSKGALARASNVHVQTIRMTEKGATSVSLNVLEAMLATLGYELEFMKK